MGREVLRPRAALLRGEQGAVMPGAGVDRGRARGRPAGSRLRPAAQRESRERRTAAATSGIGSPVSVSPQPVGSGAISDSSAAGSPGMTIRARAASASSRARISRSNFSFAVTAPSVAAASVHEFGERLEDRPAALALVRLAPIARSRAKQVEDRFGLLPPKPFVERRSRLGFLHDHGDFELLDRGRATSLATSAARTIGTISIVGVHLRPLLRKAPRQRAATKRSRASGISRRSLHGGVFYGVLRGSLSSS